MKKLILIGVVVILLAGCAAPKSAQVQAASAAAAVVPTATRAQPTPTIETQATATASPTVAPSATTAITSPAPTVVATSVADQPASVVKATYSTASSVVSSAASGVRLSLNPNKYSTPALLTPDNNATYHVSQPVVHLAWTATPTDLMTFGQTTACVSDATNFRRAFESYQLVIHSLDVSQPDIVQWTENSTTLDWNLTTVPQGRYSWSVNVVTLCESYVVGQRSKTIARSLLSPASPTSAVRTINWIP